MTSQFASRPLIIGLGPSARGVQEPLAGSSSAVLARMAGMRHADFLARVDRVNLCPLGELEALRDAVLEHRLAVALSGLLRGRDVVLLGDRVRCAFGLRDPERADYAPFVNRPLTQRGHPTCVWLDWGTDLWGWARVALLPHPSGRDRWYNEAANRALAEGFLRTALGQACPAR